MRSSASSAAPAPAKELRRQFLKNSRKRDIQIAPGACRLRNAPASQERPPLLGKHDQDLGHPLNAIECLRRMARRRAVSLSYYERDRKRRERKSRCDWDERAQWHARRCSISFRSGWGSDRESIARDLSGPRNRRRSLGNFLSIGGETSDQSRGSPSARRRDRRDLTASPKDRLLE